MAKLNNRMHNEQQKQVAALFAQITGKYNLWKLWQDFITLAALEISNAVDEYHREERTKEYSRIAAQYSQKEMTQFAKILAQIVEGLEKDRDQDFLGELFMGLELGNDSGGQFFTPYNICKMMAQMQGSQAREKLETENWISVNDPACGAGATLMAFANECILQGMGSDQVLFVGQDIDAIAAMMCYIQLSLCGCAGYVVIGDTLAHPAQAIGKNGLIPNMEQRVFLTPAYFTGVWGWRRKWSQI